MLSQLLVRAIIRSHLSLVPSLCTADLARVLPSAHSFASALSCSWENIVFKAQNWAVMNNSAMPNGNENEMGMEWL